MVQGYNGDEIGNEDKYLTGVFFFSGESTKQYTIVLVEKFPSLVSTLKAVGCTGELHSHICQEEKGVVPNLQFFCSLNFFTVSTWQ